MTDKISKEEAIEDEFSFLIRDRLDERDFWEYIKSWKDEETLCEEMEAWDIKTKMEEIKKIKGMCLENE